MAVSLRMVLSSLALLCTANGFSFPAPSFFPRQATVRCEHIDRHADTDTVNVAQTPARLTPQHPMRFTCLCVATQDSIN